MSSAQKLKSSPSRPRRLWAPRGRAYVFLVATLAVFLFGFAMTYRPPHGYLAEVTVAHRAVAADGSPVGNAPLATQLTQITKQAAAELTDATAIRLAAIHAQLLDRDDDDPADVESLRRQVSVTANPSAAREEVALTIHVSQEQSQAAVALADALAQHYVQDQTAGQQTSQLERNCRNAHQEVKQAEINLAATSSQVETLLAEQMTAMEQLKQLHASRPSSLQEIAPDPVTPPPTQSVPRAPATIANPRRAELSNELRTLTADRDRLLKTRTELHPEVRNVLIEMEAVQSQLTDTPAEIPNPDYHSPTEKPLLKTQQVEQAPRKQQDQAVAALISKHQGVVVEISGRYRQAQQQLDAARACLIAAEAAEKQATRRCATAKIPLAEIAIPAQLVGQLGTGASLPHMLLLLTGSLICGVALMRISGLRTCQGVFLSTMELEKQLGLPVLAAIPTSDGPPLASRENSTGQIARVAIVVCEVVLVVAVLLLLVTLVSDWQTAGTALQDPLTTIAESFWRLTR